MLTDFNQCSTSIPPEHIRKRTVFRGYRSGTLFGNGLIILGEEECNVTKTTQFRSWFNAVRKASDSTNAFLEDLQVQILKTLPLGANHGGAPAWPLTWQNSTDAQIIVLSQPQTTPPEIIRKRNQKTYDFLMILRQIEVNPLSLNMRSKIWRRFHKYTYSGRGMKNTERKQHDFDHLSDIENTNKFQQNNKVNWMRETQLLQSKNKNLRCTW